MIRLVAFSAGYIISAARSVPRRLLNRAGAIRPTRGRRYRLICTIGAGRHRCRWTSRSWRSTAGPFAMPPGLWQTAGAHMRLMHPERGPDGLNVEARRWRPALRWTLLGAGLAAAVALAVWTVGAAEMGGWWR